MDDRFAAVAGIAATLVGLLFVALALNPSVKADDGPAGLCTWAGQTFYALLMALAFTLVVLIPDVDPIGLRLPVLLLGAWGVARVVADLRQVRRDPAPKWRRCAALTRFASPLAGHAAATWAVRCCAAAPTRSADWWPRSSSS